MSALPRAQMEEFWAGWLEANRVAERDQSQRATLMSSMYQPRSQPCPPSTVS